MRFAGFFFALCALAQHAVLALLEEKFVSFVSGNGSLDIAGATILADADDFVGVHIALNSLIHDYEQITGKRPALRNMTANSTALGNTTIPASRSSIIVGSLDSPLIQQMSARGVLDISDIEGKWEVFQTAVVEEPFAGVGRALVIAGSDKRGTIFGVHTLAEQSGQSP